MKLVPETSKKQSNKTQTDAELPRKQKLDKPHPLFVSRKNIDNFKQNKPSLILRDLTNILGVNKAIAAKILLARGVAKIFVQRKRMFGLYQQIIFQIKESAKDLALIKKPRSRDIDPNIKDYYTRLGEIQAYVRIRKEVEDIIHLRGIVLPENDREFIHALSTRGNDLLKQLGTK